MIYFILFCISVLFYLSVTFRIILFNPFKTIYNSVNDLYKYIRYKQWRLCHKDGKLLLFTGLFGHGKTLSGVHYLTTIYDRYNGKLVYDFRRNKWVTQKIQILSNVRLIGYPYQYLTNLSQLVTVAETINDIDNDNDTLTFTFAFIDEMSVQLNSRSYSSNIDGNFLNTLLTCRHYRLSLYATSQRFNLVDKLIRENTTEVINCNKLWRFMRHTSFDANELEQATSEFMVKPKKRFGWFIRNKDYNVYDTLACVENLTKSCKDGDMLTPEEILARQEFTPNNDNIVKRSRRHKKRYA